MKRKLLLSLSILLGLTASAQTTLGDIFDKARERVRISGYGQYGYTYDHENGGETSSSFDLKRANITIDVRITDKWSATFTPEFNGGKILELYTDYTVLPYLKFKAGQFKTPFTLENKISSSRIELISGGSQAMRYLVPTDGSYDAFKGTGGRDLGFMVYGDLYYGLVTYELAIMNGSGIGIKDTNNDKDFVGRLTLNAGDNLKISGSTIIGRGHAENTDTIIDVKDGQNYKRNRWSVGADYKSQILDLRLEYLEGKDYKTKSNGIYLTGTYHLLDKLDLIGSIDYFNKNKDLSDKSWNYVAGVQYWFFKKCRLQAQYVYRDNHIGGNSSALMAQVQVGF